MRIRIVRRLNRLLDEIARPPNFMMKAANNWKAVLGLYIFTILCGAAVFSFVEEGRSFWDGIWWACITGLSIGYGDLYPVTTTGRVVGLVLAHVVLLIIVPMIIAQITLRLIRDNDKFTHSEQEEVKNELDTLLARQALIMKHLGIAEPEHSSDNQ